MERYCTLNSYFSIIIKINTRETNTNSSTTTRLQVQCSNFQIFLKIQLWKWVGQRHRNSDPFSSSAIFVVSFLHLQDLLKVIYNGFYSFSISHFVLKLFRFVWYVNEINYDVKWCTDYCKLLKYVYLQDYWAKVGFVWFKCVEMHLVAKF